jgi:DtxR family Mn-dependent transcriptional regulator
MNELDYKILKFLYDSENPLKVSNIALGLDAPHSTIGSGVKRLQKANYIEYIPYQKVRLSQAGEDLALEIIRHCRLFEILLFESLKINPKQAHLEAEKINLLISCEIIDKICMKFNHPKQCPCGNKILNSGKCFCKETL